MNYLPILKVSNSFHELKHEEGQRLFITYYFQSDSCFQGQQFACQPAKRQETTYASQWLPAHTHVFPTWSPLKKSHPPKHEFSQEHVLLNSHLSSASESGAVFQGYAHFRQGSRQVGCPHRPCGFHPPLTAGRKLTTLMWLAHRLAAPPPQEVDQVDFWEIGLLSLTVCFVGRLTECQGSWGVAVWMTGQQGSAGDLPAQAKRSTFPSTMGCSFDFSPSLPSV